MTERQKYDLIKKVDDVELRRYHECVMADVIVNSPYSNAANLGFRPLVTYISENRIAMTAPVVQEQLHTDSWVVSFVMPADMKLDSMPLPKNRSVTLRTITEHTAAALVFRGVTTEHMVRVRENQLRQTLQNHNIPITGPMRIARFDPPWKPGFMRHNEVIVPVALP